MQRKIINIDGQELEYWYEKKMLKINIGSPFNSAAKRYGWNVKSKGIGIANKIVKQASKRDLTLIIELDNIIYSIEAWIVESFCEKTNSIYHKQIGFGELLLYVYPLKLMKEESMNDLESNEKQSLIKEYNI
jgi:hypothetical protein